MEKLTAVTIKIPFKSAGNVIQQKEVEFDVYHDRKQYSLRPILTETERRIANLPETLDFELVAGKAVSTRGAKDSNMHVITDIVEILKKQDLIS